MGFPKVKVVGTGRNRKMFENELDAKKKVEFDAREKAMMQESPRKGKKLGVKCMGS